MKINCDNDYVMSLAHACFIMTVFSAVRIETTGQTYRGFAIQARESTPSFSSTAAFVGQFVNPPAETRIWDCAAVCYI